MILSWRMGRGDRISSQIYQEIIRYLKQLNLPDSQQEKSALETVKV